MCGIFGYVGGQHHVANTVGTALRSLEYRGYDSWGIVWRGDLGLRSAKQVGRVPISFEFDDYSSLAVGHTRWATHGGVTQENAHPHLDCLGKIAVVHNGIVENASSLKRSLSRQHTFTSDTDSEVIVHLLEEQLDVGVPLLAALRHVFPQLLGQNAVIAIDQRTDEIIGVMNVSPLVVGTGPDGVYIASDPYVLSGKADRMTVVPNATYVRLGNGIIEILDDAGQILASPRFEAVPHLDEHPLGQHSHFMSKEMAEQPGILLRQLDHGNVSARLGEHFRTADRIILTGCGSAYLAARIGASWLSRICNRPSIAIPASEFQDVRPFVGRGSLVVGITQSGETADLLHALNYARDQGSNTLALVNVMHSTAARLADEALPLDAGRERSVLATKSLVAMLGRLLMGCGLAAERADEVALAIRNASAAIEELSSSAAFDIQIDRVASFLATRQNVLIIGNGVGVGVAMEAALKLKEGGYIHAEGFAAGELKHGAIALVEKDTPCLVFAADPDLVVEMASPAQELRSRGGYTVGIGMDASPALSDRIDVPAIGLGAPLVHVFVAQSLAYRLAVKRGLDPDFPRNLAKSVTVR